MPLQIETTTETLVKHTMVLTAQQMTKLMEDPYGFRDDVEIALTGSNGIATPKKRTKRTARDITIGRAKAPRKTKAKANGAAPKHARRAGAVFPKVPCSKCGKMIGRPQLGRHESKCEGIAAGAESSLN